MKKRIALLLILALAACGWGQNLMVIKKLNGTDTAAVLDTAGNLILWQSNAKIKYAGTNIAIGDAGNKAISGNDNTVIGDSAGASLAAGTGNLVIGEKAGSKFNGSYNLVAGPYAARSARTLTYTTMLGYRPCQILDSGLYVISMGFQNMDSSIVGIETVSLGAATLARVDTVLLTTAIGNDIAAYGTKVERCSWVGYGICPSVDFKSAVGCAGIGERGNTFARNIREESFLGPQALYSDTGGTNSVGIGKWSGNGVKLPDTCHFYGFNSGSDSSALRRAIVIGHYGRARKSNSITFGATGANAVDIIIDALPYYANKAAAKAAGKIVGTLYCTGADSSSIGYINQ